MAKERINFISKTKRLQIWKDDKKLAQFEDMGGGYGGFSTDDDQLVSKLKEDPGFGRTFNSLEGASFPKFLDPRVHVGAQTSKKDDTDKIKANAKAEAELEAAKRFAEMKMKVKRFGELEGKWLKKDGEFRADIPDEEKEEYNKLKLELGE